MPVFLGPYFNGATSRNLKFIRSVFSFLDNDYHNKELIICSDGCDESEDIYKRHKENWPNVFLYKIEKQPQFSGTVRQYAIERSTGDKIAYLDSDDELGSKHLSAVMQGFNHTNYEFLYWDDSIRTDKNILKKRKTELKFSKIGTSCIAHKRVFRKAGFEPSWKDCDGYGHDWFFIKKSIEHTQRHGKIQRCDYQVRHAPHLGIDN